MVSAYAILDANGVCINRVLWDGESDWQPPEGCTAVPDSDGQYAIYVPPQPEPNPEPESDWEGFYSGLLTSSAFAHINAAARTDPAIAVAYADAGFALTRASLGLVNVEAIQASLDGLLAVMTGGNAIGPAGRQELQTLLETTNLSSLITLNFVG